MYPLSHLQWKTGDIEKMRGPKECESEEYQTRRMKGVWSRSTSSFHLDQDGPVAARERKKKRRNRNSDGIEIVYTHSSSSLSLTTPFKKRIWGRNHSDLASTLLNGCVKLWQRPMSNGRNVHKKKMFRRRKRREKKGRNVPSSGLDAIFWRTAKLE